jgi:WD40 repeat protein
MRYTPGERFVKTASNVRIWDWEQDRVVQTLDTPALRAVFDPSSPLLAVSRWLAGEVETWDTETGEQVATLAGHTSQAVDLSFSHDGSRLATAGADGTVRLWDPHSGRQQLVLRGTEGEVGTAVFSPDGSKLASAGADGLVRIWALDLDDVIGIAEARLTRAFTEEECRQYLHLERCSDEPS